MLAIDDGVARPPQAEAPADRAGGMLWLCDRALDSQ